MMLRRGAAWAAALVSTAVCAAPICGAHLPAKARQSIEQNGTTLVFAPRGGPIKIGQPFSLDIAVCPAPRALTLDADMPAHRHGMNYRATVQSLGDGRYRAEGLLWHMPGRWRLQFDVERAGTGRERLEREWVVE